MSKEKMLCVLDILKKTDEEHALTIGEIINKLHLYGIEAERKSVSRDIQTLIDSGYTILSAGKREGYFMVGKDFDDYELAMLYAAVACAKFITEDDTRNIHKKIKNISAPSIENLLSEMVAIGAIKTDNKAVKYSIDKIIRAIRDNKRLKFQYIEYNADAKKQLRRGGHIYKVSPFFLAWANEELYLIANPDSHSNLTHFKVAMLTNTEITAEKRKSRNEIEELTGDFDLSKYLRENINMYSGETVTVTLRFHYSILSDIVSTFGQDIWLSKSDGEWLSCKCQAVDNDGLYGWIMQYGDKIEIVSPSKSRKAVIRRLSTALARYG